MTNPSIWVVLGAVIVLLAGLLIWSNRDAATFGKLWNYFAWANQVLAAFALMAGTIYLVNIRRPAFITALPGLFITFVVTSYILWTSLGHDGPIGLGLELDYAYIIAGFVSLAVFAWAWVRAGSIEKLNE